jgi:hypothetical protein
MRTIFTLFMALFMASSMVFAGEAGTLTPTPNPIVPNASVTINYDGTGTNFANWTPRCFIHVWLVPKAGQTFTGNYAPAWTTCNSDGEYDALDAKYKMTHDGTANSGKYSITIANLYTFFNVLEEDKAKVDKFGIIVRAQYSGGNNQTNDFLLNVTNPSTGVEKNIYYTTIRTDNNTISASFAGNANIQLFTATGQQICSEHALNQFSMRVKSGIYLMSINGKSTKVVVK